MTGRARGRSRGRARARGAQDDGQAPRPGAEQAAAVPRPQSGPQGAVGGVAPQVVEAPRVPQGAEGGPPSQPPPPGAGRASFRGSYRQPGSAPEQVQVPADRMAELSLGDQPEGGARGPPGFDRRRMNPYEEFALRPAHIHSKTGTSGTEVVLKSNFFKVTNNRNYSLHQYSVAFMPPKDGKKLKIGLVMGLSDLGEVKLFDGTVLYLPHKLKEDPTVFNALVNHDQSHVKITITYTCEVMPNTAQTVQVMNLILRRMMRHLGMSQINRHYFDMEKAIEVPDHKLRVIPGFETSILRYENDLLLGVDVTHKIMRSITVLDHMYELYNSLRGRGDFHSLATKELVGQIVLTRYNNKTYRVDDIEWAKHPSDTFEIRPGVTKSYVDYYHSHYQVTIKDQTQPLLVSMPKKRDIRRGMSELIYLIPELCIVTGLSAEAKANYRLMNDVAVHTRVAPDGRIDRLLTFMRSLKEHPKASEELSNWHLDFDNDIVKIKGRVVQQEELFIKDSRGNQNKISFKAEDADWSRDMKEKKMTLSVALNTWLVIFPPRSRNAARDLVSTISRVGPPMGMGIAEPKMVELQVDRNEAYLTTLRQHINPTVQMVCLLVNGQKKDRYDSIKKFCCVDCPVPSQVVLMKSATHPKNLMSIATKIAIQMNCKMGGVVWNTNIPVRGAMVIGIDTYHDSSVKGRSCAGVVCTTNTDFTRYHSSVSYQMTHDELQKHLTISTVAGLRAFMKENGGKAPSKILVFRDGVGDGQMQAVKECEVPQVLAAMKTALGVAEEDVRLAYVIVKKRINARLFRQGQIYPPKPPRGQQGGGGPPRRGAVNPAPGTIVDTVITKQLSYDFFLVAQSVRQGTVGPTNFNVVYDTSGFQPDHIQRLAYKLTHMYYNWQGTIRVPAPCMYAHKLAFLCGQSLHRDFDGALADKLFFL